MPTVAPPGPDKSSRCQSPFDRSPGGRIASVADPVVFDLVAEQFLSLSALIYSLDLVEGPFAGNMGSRPASDPDARLTPGPEFSGFLARGDGGGIRISASLRPADGAGGNDEIIYYELLLSGDLLIGDVIEKSADGETRFSWTAEDIAREREIRARRAN